jgi:Ca-activated chloride channel family protein
MKGETMRSLVPYRPSSAAAGFLRLSAVPAAISLTSLLLYGIVLWLSALAGVSAMAIAAAPAAVALALAAAAGTLLLAPSPARAHVIGGPPPPPRVGTPARSYEVTELSLSADVTGQMATAVLTTRFRNVTRGVLEMDYLAPLPQGASVVSAVLMEEGRELMGKVYVKEEAFRIYSETVAQMKDPALIEYAGKDTYRARIYPVPPGEERTLELTMSFLVPREKGLCALSVPLAGPVTRGHDIVRQEFVVRFKDTPGLSNVYSPLDGVSIARQGAGGSARYEAERAPALDAFRLFYATGSDGIGASLISHRPSPDEDGYFLFMAEPPLDEGAPPLPKDVCFVLDISGSMCGVKFRQASEAMRFILERLSPEDRFGFVHFNTQYGQWKHTLEPMTPESRAGAEEYLSRLRPSGGTNIGTPLGIALHMMDPSRPGYVLFLTDGEANAGVTDERPLEGLIRAFNTAGSRIFSFGVGYDLNARLLERFSRVTGGSTTFVDETENIESKVSEFFSRLTSPVLTSPELKCSLPLNRTSPGRLPDLFAGGQISLVGRYPSAGEASFELSGLVAGERKTFGYGFELSGSPTPEASFLRTLWATRRSAQILEELDLSDLSGEAGARLRKELTDELVTLARSYGVLTPFTSFLATEDLDLNRTDDNFREIAGRLGILNSTSGRDAVLARRMRHRDADAMSLGAVPPPPSGVLFCKMPPDNLGDLVSDSPASVPSDCMEVHSSNSGFDPHRFEVARCLPSRPMSPAAMGPPAGSAYGGSTCEGGLESFIDPSEVDCLLLNPSAQDEEESSSPSGDMVPPETIGGRTFFVKDGVLTEGVLTAEELEGAKEVEQFSEEYFALASEIPPEGLGWLSQDRPVVFRWKGAVYRVVPQASEKSA